MTKMCVCLYIVCINELVILLFHLNLLKIVRLSGLFWGRSVVKFGAIMLNLLTELQFYVSGN